MSLERTQQYLARVQKIVADEILPPGEMALLYASLAQVEATLEIADQLKGGLPLSAGPLSDALEMFSVSADALSRRLGDG